MNSPNCDIDATQLRLDGSSCRIPLRLDLEPYAATYRDFIPNDAESNPRIRELDEHLLAKETHGRPIVQNLLGAMKADPVPAQEQDKKSDSHEDESQLSSFESESSDSGELSEDLNSARLEAFHRRRMLDRDRRNQYRLSGIIDYDEDKCLYITHVVKKDEKNRWWYTIIEDQVVRPNGTITGILKTLKAPHMLFYERV